MLRLADQIVGDDIGIGRAVGDDQDLGRAGEQIDTDAPEQQTLRLGDVATIWPLSRVRTLSAPLPYRS